MGGSGGGGNFGSVGGVADPGLANPSYMPGGGPVMAAPNIRMPASAFQPQMGMDPSKFLPKQPSAFRTALGKAGQLATAWDQAGQQMQQQRPSSQPINFNIPAQQYIPPPQPMNNPFYGG